MNNMPLKLREQLSNDPYYENCARENEDCKGQITWEHCFVYQGKSLQAPFALIPLCWEHHLGKLLDKRENAKIALLRASEEDLKAYSKRDFLTEKRYFENDNNIR